MKTRRNILSLIPAFAIIPSLMAQDEKSSAGAYDVCAHEWTITPFRLTNFVEQVAGETYATTAMNPPIGEMRASGPPLSACSKCGVLKCDALKRA